MEVINSLYPKKEQMKGFLLSHIIAQPSPVPTLLAFATFLLLDE